MGKYAPAVLSKAEFDYFHWWKYKDVKYTERRQCHWCLPRVRSVADNQRLSDRASGKFPKFIGGLRQWTRGFTLTFRDKHFIPDEELHQEIEVWNPTLKWVNRCAAEWQKLQDFQGNEFMMVLERGKLGTERYHIHGVSTAPIKSWGAGWWEQVPVEPAWVNYVAKYMVKEPLGFWSNI